jgi:sulfur carrier protein
MVTIKVNGVDRSFEEPLTVSDLIRFLEIKNSTIAVDVNQKIVPRSSHPAHQLQDGDRVEIVTFVGGG